MMRRAIEGPGKASVADRRAAAANAGVPEALVHFIDKVTRHAYKITDEDVEHLKRAGIAEDAIFELAVCAALGEASRQLDAAMAALDAAEAQSKAPR